MRVPALRLSRVSGEVDQGEGAEAVTQTETKKALVVGRKADVKAKDRRENDVIVVKRANEAGEVILDKTGEGRIGRHTAAQLRARLAGYELRYR